MKNIIGPPVSGDDFNGHDGNLNKGRRFFNNGNSFLILGIRRTGKSSFLKQIAFLIRQESSDNICIELDCSTFESVLDFYRNLYDEMPKSLKDKFKKTLQDSKQIPVKIIDFITDFLKSVDFAGSKLEFHDKAIDYAKPFETLVTDFFKNTEEKVYLFLDELPFFFENLSKNSDNISEITHILINLRNWRNEGIPMGITGSLNLHQQLEQLGISRKLLAGLNTIELKPFTRGESKLFLEKLASSDNNKLWNEEVSDAILDLLPDYLPYFLQYSYNEIVVSECKTKEDVNEIFHNEIVPGLLKDFLYQFDERLKIFRGKELINAISILDTIASKEPINMQDLQEATKNKFNYEIVVKLIDYEFLKISGQQEYSFSLKFIKNWWIDKRGLKK